MLELKKVSKIYKTKSQDVHALDGVDLYFEETGLVFITGKSGSGKTTLLNVIGGLDNFDEGEILIKDKSTKDFTKSDYDSYRNTYVGFVFQEYNLLDNMSIYKNISLATELQGKKDSKEEIEKILAKVDLNDVGSRRPPELSGGQRQRVAIARALVKNPSIIMADEPTGALDTENGLQIMSILKKLAKDKLVIVVSHDLELADKFADRIINMKDGKIESDITVKSDNAKQTNIVEKKDILSIRRGAKLKDAEMQKIKSAIESGKDVHVTDKIDVIKKQTVIEKKKVYEKSSPFIKTHLGLWDTIKLGLNTLKTKRVRLAVTIILCALAFSIFGIFDSMAIYDEARLATNTISSSITPSVTMNVRESSENDTDINLGDTLISTINSQTGYDIKGVYNSYYIGTSTPTELNQGGNYYSISKYYYYKALRGAVEFDQEDLSKYKFTILNGRLAEEYDEIAISEYFAYCMINWGYTYTNEDKEEVRPTKIEELINAENPLPLTLGTSSARQTYKIVGIVNTGKIHKKFDKLKENFENSSTMDQNEFINYIKNSFNLYAFVKPGFVNNAMVKYNTLNKYITNLYNYEFTSENSKINTRVKSFYNFNNLDKLVSNNYTESFKPYFFLDNTKTELTGTEVLIDINQFQTMYSDIIISLKSFAENSYTVYPQLTGYATEIDYKLGQLKKLNKKEDVETKVAYLQDIIAKLDEIQAVKDSELGNDRTESILQRSFKVKKTDSGKGTKIFKLDNDTYKIVGFYTDVRTDANSIITSNDGISNLGITLMQGPYSSFLATNTGRGNASKLSGLLLRKSGLCYTCSDNAVAMINTYSDFFFELSLLFLIASAVFALFSIVMFSNFISTSIKNKYGEIGILRALGARGVDILKMFVVEAVTIALINAVCACVVAAIGCVLVNMFLSTYLNIYIPLAAFGIRQVGIIFALSVGVGIVSAVMPIWSVSKQKPVETIRKAF